jgi:hypothetical protein
LIPFDEADGASDRGSKCEKIDLAHMLFPQNAECAKDGLKLSRLARSTPAISSLLLLL